jgi:hypothetical protein
MISHNQLVSVPVGFIYVQLPDYPSPTLLWPNLVWRSVTERFAGLFFRAEGGNSSSFGTIQTESSNHLSQANYQDFDYNNNNLKVHISIPENGEYSDFMYAGYWSSNTLSTEGIRFANSGAENRPINTAIKIWERI